MSTRDTAYLLCLEVKAADEMTLVWKLRVCSTANEEARTAADASADKPCVEPPEALHGQP